MKLIPIFVSMVLSLTTMSAAAATHDFAFSGSVTSVSTELDTEFTLGETVIGMFSYQDSVLDHNPSSSSGFYPANFFIQATFGGDYLASSVLGSTVVFNDLAGVDRLIAAATPAFGGSVVAGAVNTHIPIYLSATFSDFDMGILSGDGLPPPSIWTNPAFDQRQLALGFDNESADGPAILVDLTTFASVSAVPEPSTYALMLAGLGFVGFVAHRRRKRESVAA